MATINDVAKMAGVSSTTVSIIVNGRAAERKISETTIVKVLDAVKVLNYQPSISARMLRSTGSDTFTVGIYWVSDYRYAFSSRFLKGVQDAKMKSKINMNIVICPYKANELYKETALYKTNSFNAVIIANTSQKDMKFIHDNPLPLPVVLNNRQSDIYNTVTNDNKEVGRKAAYHLLARGAKTFGLVSLTNGFYAMNRSTEGFLQVCEEHNITIKPEHRLLMTNWSEGGFNAVDKFLNSGPLPDGIFCDNDAAALGLITAFNKHTVKVPKQVQVVATGLLDPSFTYFCSPSITIVSVPLEKMGEGCIKIVERIANHKINEPVHLKFASELFQRESTLEKPIFPEKQK